MACICYLDQQTACINYIYLALRLLDMGYEKDVAEIVTALNTKGNEHRQTVLLSATLTTGKSCTRVVLVL